MTTTTRLLKWDSRVPITADGRNVSLQFENYLYQTIAASVYDATTDPTVEDDTQAGFISGSEWYNTTNNAFFKCVDSTTGNAVWVQLN